MIEKNKPLRSKKLRDSAKGQECTLQIPGVCNNNPETVVLCHLNTDGGRTGGKGCDHDGVYGCSSCHSHIDFPPHPQQFATMEDYRYDQLIVAQQKARALFLTWQHWINEGLITIKGAK